MDKSIKLTFKDIEVIMKVLEKEKNRIIVEIQDLIGKVYRQEI